MDKYLSKGWIRPRTYSYGAPILLARNKYGTLRMGIDYKSINQKTRPKKHPLAGIDNILDRLANLDCLSSIELYTRYY